MWKSNNPLMKIESSPASERPVEILRKLKHTDHPQAAVWAECIYRTVRLQRAVTVSTTTRVCVCHPPPCTDPLTSHSGSSKHPLRKQQAELIWLTWRRSLPFSSLPAYQCFLPKCPTIFSSIDTSLSSACSPLQRSLKLIKVHSNTGIK